jgi:hypothetical protein
VASVVRTLSPYSARARWLTAPRLEIPTAATATVASSGKVRARVSLGLTSRAASRSTGGEAEAGVTHHLDQHPAHGQLLLTERSV